MNPNFGVKPGKTAKSLVWPLILIVALGLGVYFMGSFQAAPPQEPQSSAQAGSPGEPQETTYLAGAYEESNPAPQAQENNWFGDMFDVFIKLVVVLGVLYLCLRGLRYLNNKSRAASSAKSPVKVLYSTSLAQHQNLYLVELGEKVLLLGGTNNQIGLLSEITDKDLISQLQVNTVSQTQPGSFASYLDRFLKSQRVEADAVSQINPASGMTVAQAIECCRGSDK